MNEIIENRTFDEIQPGDSASLVRQLSERDIQLFAVMSGDVNPAHVDREFARDDQFHQIIGHGMWAGALISTVLGTQLPGPGTIYLDQSLHFENPVRLGDTLTVTVTAREKDAEQSRIVFDCTCTRQDGERAVTGTAEVLAPANKIRRPRVTLPEVEMHDRGAKLRRLIDEAKAFEPLGMAVVHPVDTASLLGAVRAAEAGLIDPVLVGPRAKIEQAAETAKLDISRYRLEATEHSHAAAARAVELVGAGEAAALMKGKLHTDELMHAVVSEGSGLRTERRVSHAFVMDVPDYERLLLITDAAINIAPDLEAKADIIQNAIDLARALGFDKPRVAILSAVETVSAKLASTIDAAALCKMADRGQITGGILDGPLAFDNAVSVEAAKVKGIVSPVAGHADILVCPDLEAGNMLAKQLEYMGDAQAAGLVLGARVPIALTSRADDELSRMASCALALRMYHWQRGREAKRSAA
ncbi:bifunctional enoyl-CoA hydratase/phosphate acetyltransferase [Ferruginivarius sediminum]|uniref:Phosphate acetyltransferase n=1 Tax=Ferruginivarius sediminum TaxID=2661937 RepID=A0A369T4J2_9PROT|nr:bifunctional enoyl-CoA hydratase/phosphate acetyltransferase [Ferruginivarius sediminum]RDD60250.1 phosphate acetyltransferase [Ferruginivarius sediminum]